MDNSFCNSSNSSETQPSIEQNQDDKLVSLLVDLQGAYLPTLPVASEVSRLWRASPGLPVHLYHSPVLRHISHLPFLSHFRDRSPCTACDFVVNGLRKICTRYCIRFVVFYDEDKTSGYLFTSFVREDLLSRWRQKERTMMRSWFFLAMMRRNKKPSAESKRICWFFLVQSSI